MIYFVSFDILYFIYISFLIQHFAFIHFTFYHLMIIFPDLCLFLSLLVLSAYLIPSLLLLPCPLHLLSLSLILPSNSPTSLTRSPRLPPHYHRSPASSSFTSSTPHLHHHYLPHISLHYNSWSYVLIIVIIPRARHHHLLFTLFASSTGLICASSVSYLLWLLLGFVLLRYRYYLLFALLVFLMRHLWFFIKYFLLCIY